MRGSKATKLRKVLLKKLPEILLILRNELGEKTEEMTARQIYQHTKRLYKEGKLKALMKGEV